MPILSYLKARLAEATTWAAISAGAAGAAAIPDERIKWMVIGCAVIGALVPEKGAANG